MNNSTPQLQAFGSRWPRLGLLLFVGLQVGQWLGLVASAAVAQPGDVKTQLLIVQTTVALSTFVAAPVVYWCWAEGQPLRRLFLWPKRYLTPILLTVGLTLACMVVNTWFIQWNRTIRLPAWLQGFEAWALAQNAAHEQWVSLLTTFQTLGGVAVGLTVIGLLPAVGEEFLFRGIVQRLLYQRLRNVHLAIGLSALIFSVIHCNLYSVVPLWLFGVLLGYLYWWTQDLCFPVLAHFCNNALVVLLHSSGVADMGVPSTPILLFFAALAALLAHRLYLHAR